jgi:hypothetical protein
MLGCIQFTLSNWVNGSDARAIVWNIIGGGIVIGIGWLCVKLRQWLHCRNLQRFLGFQFAPETVLRIAYGQLLLVLPSQNNSVITHPYSKAPRFGGPQPLPGAISIQHPVSESEVRAAAYIASLIGIPAKVQTPVVSDVEVDQLLNSNFIAVGGIGSNYKTADILASSANIFIQMLSNDLTLPTGESLPHSYPAGVERGFILRITSPQFPDRSWIVCAGLGEYGTSGSAWYLAHRWEKLVSLVDPDAQNLQFKPIPDFCAIVTVTTGQDQSTTLAELYRNQNGQLQQIQL